MKRNILIPIDFTEKSFITLEHGCNLAKLFDADITVLHIRQDTKKALFFSLFTEEETKEMKKKYIEQLHLKMKTIIDKVSKKYKVKINTMISKGRVFEKIVEIAETINAELILVDKGTEENNSKNYIGTNALRIVRQAQCPVLIHNNYDFSSGFKRILLPLDLSKETRQKVNKAIEIAKRCNSEIYVVSGLLTEENYVVNHLQAQLKQVDKFIKDSGVKCTSELVKGEKKESLPDLILRYGKEKNADLIILMTQQEVEWVEYFVASNAQEMIRKSEIPVLTIIPKDINFVLPAY